MKLDKRDMYMNDIDYNFNYDITYDRDGVKIVTDNGEYEICTLVNNEKPNQLGILAALVECDSTWGYKTLISVDVSATICEERDYSHYVYLVQEYEAGRYKPLKDFTF